MTRRNAVDAGEALPEGDGMPHRVRRARWYDPGHGEGKTTQAPCPPQQGEPRPSAERRPRLSLSLRDWFR
jgi:hypothetical protein